MTAGLWEMIVHSYWIGMSLNITGMGLKMPWNQNENTYPFTALQRFTNVLKERYWLKKDGLCKSQYDLDKKIGFHVEYLFKKMEIMMPKKIIILI